MKYIDKFWKKVEVRSIEECWNWKGEIRARYGYFKPSNEKGYRAHRFAWMATFGKIPPNIFVCHACDNPICVNPNHLWLGTAKDNAQDMIQKGRASKIRAFGEKSGKSVLTEEKVKQILDMHRTGKYSHRQLARIMSVSKSAIQSVLYNRTWKHIPRVKD